MGRVVRTRAWTAIAAMGLSVGIVAIPGGVALAPPAAAQTSPTTVNVDGGTATTVTVPAGMNTMTATLVAAHH